MADLAFAVFVEKTGFVDAETGVLALETVAVVVVEDSTVVVGDIVEILDQELNDMYRLVNMYFFH